MRIPVLKEGISPYTHEAKPRDPNVCSIAPWHKYWWYVAVNVCTDTVPGEHISVVIHKRPKIGKPKVTDYQDIRKEFEKLESILPDKFYVIKLNDKWAIDMTCLSDDARIEFYDELSNIEMRRPH